MQNNGLEEWKSDYILSGHPHGGHVIIPEINVRIGWNRPIRIIPPDAKTLVACGWFPGKLDGLYSSADGTNHLILSRGLGSAQAIPRFNNIPEVAVADLVPEK